MINRLLAILTTLTILASLSHAATYHVSPKGTDSNPGTEAKPFQTIQKAADAMGPGDICRIQGGSYREAVILRKSGQPGKPIRFVAEEGQVVTLDGTAPVAGTWSRHKGGIYKIKIETPIEQLFVDREMMVEARWPNMRFDTQLFDRKCWAATTKGSRYGLIKDPELAETGIDWTGALITLNVAHQFFSWTRTVESHGLGTDTLTYPRDMEGLTRYAEAEKGWDDDYYWVSGKLEALDIATEWFYDSQKKLLYLHAPGSRDPSEFDVSYRKRQYAVTGDDLRHVELTGLHFFACAFQFENCSDIVVDGCQLTYPTYSRCIPRRKKPSQPEHQTSISGTRNVVRNSVIAFASGTGLLVSGDSNLVENCIIHDVCWNGSLAYVGLRTRDQGTISRHNTIYNGGNALLHCTGGEQVVEYNHVYNGGLLCRDISLIYTQLPRCRGTVIHHNWAHGCQTEGFRGQGRGGMGIRGDDQTRGLTVHHNVVWDCGVHGIIVKGDDNRVFNNTVFDIGPIDPAKRNQRTSKHLLIPSRPEPKKPWRKQFDLLEVQNANSLFYNNAVGNIVWRGGPLPTGDKIAHNLELAGKPIEAWLVSPKKMDFRPREGSPLIDAGKAVPGLKRSYEGKAPDIGAYEYGAEPWTAGITWDPKKVLGYVPAGYE